MAKAKLVFDSAAKVKKELKLTGWEDLASPSGVCAAAKAAGIKFTTGDTRDAKGACCMLGAHYFLTKGIHPETSKYNPDETTQANKMGYGGDKLVRVLVRVNDHAKSWDEAKVAYQRLGM